jgi:hypothetical protein
MAIPLVDNIVSVPQLVSPDLLVSVDYDQLGINLSTTRLSWPSTAFVYVGLTNDTQAVTKSADPLYLVAGTYNLASVKMKVRRELKNRSYTKISASVVIFCCVAQLLTPQ